jgi:type II secretory pathway pseudopilin PulG
MIFEGVSRAFQVLRGGRGPVDARICFDESLSVSQGQSDGGEMTRAGCRFQWGFSAQVAVAAVSALPTTGARWSVWNNDPSKSYWIDSLGLLATAIGTPTGGQVMLATIYQAPATIGSSTSGYGVVNASNGGKISKALLRQAFTITTPEAPILVPIALNPSGNSGLLSVACENRDLRGRLIIPPQSGLGLSLLVTAASTAFYTLYGSHYELDTTLE